MKNLIATFLLSVISFGVFSQNFTYSEDYPKYYKLSKIQDDANFYESLRSRFNEEGENFTKEEVIRLLIGQTAQKSYNAYGMVGLERSFLATDQVSPDTLLKYGKLVYEMNPVDLSVNYGLWMANAKIKNEQETKKYEARFKLIAESILSTGDGSKERPYFVISPIDGYVLITKYYEKEIGTMGSGEDSKGYFLDILEMVDAPDNKTLHFVIDHGMGGLSKILSEIE